MGVVHQHHPPPLFGIQIATGSGKDKSEERRRNLAKRKRWLEGETSFGRRSRKRNTTRPVMKIGGGRAEGGRREEKGGGGGRAGRVPAWCYSEAEREESTYLTDVSHG